MKQLLAKVRRLFAEVCETSSFLYVQCICELGLVVRGKHWIQTEERGDVEAAKRHRFKAQEVFMDSQLSFVPTTMSLSEWQAKFKMEYSSLGSSSLPENVHLLTLEEWAGNSRYAV